MKKIQILLFFILAFSSFNISANCATENKPRWPLDIEISQSSSFAEFRGMRFHAGLDIRTKQTNGFPVYAIEDGFISRASVQFTGYGFGLYIDHPKLGVRVVYGHLKCFNGPIKDYIDSKLKAKGSRHGVTEFFKADKFPVKKGQLVAYSGESGAGPSHLHFEMRNFQDEPIAPCKYGYRPKDNIFPNIYGFYVEPMEYGAVIDGSFLGKKYSLIKDKKKPKELYSLSASPVVWGKVGFQLGIADTSGIGHKYGVENISLTLNGRKLLQRDFYQFSYDNTRQCPWVYDYFKSNMTGTGFVVNLFKMPYETLPFSKDYVAWSGVVNANTLPGYTASVEVLATDYGLNKVKVYGEIKKSNYDFARPLMQKEFSKYVFSEKTTNLFETIVVCKNNDYSKKVATNDDLIIKSGCVEVKDSLNRKHLVPCLYNTQKMELAFRNEQCWTGGAWLEGNQVLSKSFFVDSKGGKISENDIEVEFKKNSLHFPLLVDVINVNNNPSDGGNKRDGFLKAYSAIWQFTPDNIVFDTEVVVRIKPRAYKGDFKKLGVYNVNNNGIYSHNGEEIENGRLKFSTRKGGRYIVLEDLIPPSFTYARHFTHYQLGNVYAFKCSDLGEGVAWLSGKATINGIKVETYADSDHKEIYVLIPSNIKLPHKVNLTAQDNAGNSGSINVTIAK